MTMDTPKSELPSPLAEAPGSAHCGWIMDCYGTPCGRPAVKRDAVIGHRFCERHAEIWEDVFGGEAVEPVAPNAEAHRSAPTETLKAPKP